MVRWPAQNVPHDPSPATLINRQVDPLRATATAHRERLLGPAYPALRGISIHADSRAASAAPPPPIASGLHRVAPLVSQRSAPCTHPASSRHTASGIADLLAAAKEAVFLPAPDRRPLVAPPASESTSPK